MNLFKIFNKLFFKIIISQLVQESWNSMKRFLFFFSLFFARSKYYTRNNKISINK